MLKKFAYNEEWRKAIRFKLKISNETLVIGHVGRFTDVRINHSWLMSLRKFRKLKKIPNLYLLVLENSMKQYIKRFGILNCKTT